MKFVSAVHSTTVLGFAALLMLLAPPAMSQDAPLAHEPPVADPHRVATQTLVAASFPREEAVVSPDGQWIAFTQNAPIDGGIMDPLRNAPGGRGIFVVSITGGDPRLVTSFTTALTDLAWSPDGSKLAFLARPREATIVRLYLVDVAGGVPSSVLGDSQYEPRSYVWLADGDIFMTATAGKRTALYVVSPKTLVIQEVDGRSRPAGMSSALPRGAGTRLVDFAASLAQRDVPPAR
ncbi:MAG: PD40 domain-containing protein [Anaerolineae bacterium]|nr:PD40 domain-containing protein [Gemmatimonadaceae bacterium]